MFKAFTLIAFALVCTLFQSSLASTFSCTDEPAVCKTKFGTQFERDFKKIHVQAIRTVFNTFIDQMSIIKSELPAESPFIKKIEDSFKIVRKNIKKLDENVNNDNNIIKEAFQDGNDGFEMDLRNNPESETMKTLLKKHDTMKTIRNVITQFNINVASLWAEMYSGLREKDLKAYPEYEQISAYMEPLKGKGLQQPSSSDYLKPIEVMGVKFDLPYLKFVAEFA